MTQCKKKSHFYSKTLRFCFQIIIFKIYIFACFGFQKCEGNLRDTSYHQKPHLAVFWRWRRYWFFKKKKTCFCSAQACHPRGGGRQVPPSEVRLQHYELRLSGEEPLSRTAAASSIRFVGNFFTSFFLLLLPVATAEGNHNLLDPENLQREQRLRFTSPQTRQSDSKPRAGRGRSESISEMNCPWRCYQICEITSFWSHSL